MALQLIEPPEVEPITRDQAKIHLRVDHNDDDEFIDSLVTAVRQTLDGKNGSLHRALITQTWQLTLDTFPGGGRYFHHTHHLYNQGSGGGEIMLPLPPLQEVVSIKYDDPDGIEQTIDPADYQIDKVSEPGWVIPVSTAVWPKTLTAINAVRILFVCGYPPGTDSPTDLAENVPAPIKAALKLMLGDLYENRQQVVVGQSVTQLPWAAEALLAPYRIFV